MVSDYHTTVDVIKASGTMPKQGEAVVSTRYYLADADFLVGLEGHDLELLVKIDEALKNPYWPLYLGRKAFPPSEPVHILGGLLSECPLRDALLKHPRRRKVNDAAGGSLRLVLETPDGEAMRIDQPISPFIERRFAPRHVRTEFIPLNGIPVLEDELCISRC